MQEFEYTTDGSRAVDRPGAASRLLGRKAYSEPYVIELGDMAELTNYSVSVRVP
jgi:hypothetical protein